MTVRNLTCIECPIGCSIVVEIEGERVVSIKGNACTRGEIYAKNEVIQPKRIVTSTMRAENGKMVPVKTDEPVKKEEIFNVMKKINETVCRLPVKIGDVLIEKVSENANIIATGEML